MKLEGITAFVTIAERGSISEAARRLGLAKSVVSERLADLERSLGARLVQRTTRKLSLTEDGHSFLLRARRILHEAAEARSEVSERRGTLVGPMRIAAPVGFGILHLGPAICAFLARHPGIDLTLELDDRFVDAAADGFDAVLRHGPIADNRLIARRLATSRRCWSRRRPIWPATARHRRSTISPDIAASSTRTATPTGVSPAMASGWWCGRAGHYASTTAWSCATRLWPGWG